MSEYPSNWREVALGKKVAVGWRCERCNHPHDLGTAHVLTVHHLDGNKANVEDWNLEALCQRCHLRVQGRVIMDQFMLVGIIQVSEWFLPHLNGYLGSMERKRLESLRDSSPLL